MSLNAEVSSFSNALNFHSWSLVILWFTALILIRKSLSLKIKIGLNLDNPTLLLCYILYPPFLLMVFVQILMLINSNIKTWV